MIPWEHINSFLNTDLVKSKAKQEAGMHRRGDPKANDTLQLQRTRSPSQLRKVKIDTSRMTNGWERFR